MALSNTAVPIYYGRFRDEVLAGRIPVCREVAMEMNRIDEMIANPNYYYDDGAIEGFVKFCDHHRHSACQVAFGRSDPSYFPRRNIFRDGLKSFGRSPPQNSSLCWGWMPFKRRSPPTGERPKFSKLSRNSTVLY